MIDDQVLSSNRRGIYTHDYQVLLVREFGLWSTTFRRVDGQEIIAPNAILAKYDFSPFDALSSRLFHFSAPSSSTISDGAAPCKCPDFRYCLLVLIDFAGGKPRC